MLDIESIKYMLLKAGWFPSIILLGGWIFIPILLLYLLHNLFFNMIKVLIYRKKQ